MLDVAAAAAAPTPTVRQHFRRAKGTGSLEDSRGSRHLMAGDITLSGEQDIFGKQVDTASLASLEANHQAWTGGTFNGATWTANSWGSTSWASTSWASTSWASTSWASTAWASTSWASTAWASTAWASTAWASDGWG